MANTSRVRAWYAGAALASILVLAAGWFLIVSPLNGQAADLQATADAKASNVQALQAQIAKLKVESKDLGTIQKQAQALRVQIPTTPSMPSLIRDISAQAKSSGAILVGITPAQPAAYVPQNLAGSSGPVSLSTPGQVNQIPVTIQITGNYAQVRTFISDIENLDRSILLTDIDITRGDTAADASSSKELKATLSGRTFMANPGAFVDPSTPTVTSGSAAGTGSGTATAN